MINQPEIKAGVADIYNDRRSTPYFSMHAHFLIQDGELDKAIDVLEYGIKQYPESAFAHYLLGKAYFTKQEWKNAQAEFERALRYFPNFINAIRFLIEINKKLEMANIVDIYEKKLKAMDPFYREDDLVRPVTDFTFDSSFETIGSSDDPDAVTDGFDYTESASESVESVAETATEEQSESFSAADFNMDTDDSAFAELAEPVAEITDETEPNTAEVDAVVATYETTGVTEESDHPESVDDPFEENETVKEAPTEIVTEDDLIVDDVAMDDASFKDADESISETVEMPNVEMIESVDSVEMSDSLDDIDSIEMDDQSDTVEIADDELSDIDVGEIESVEMDSVEMDSVEMDSDDLGDIEVGDGDDDFAEIEMDSDADVVSMDDDDLSDIVMDDMDSGEIDGDIDAMSDIDVAADEPVGISEPDIDDINLDTLKVEPSNSLMDNDDDLQSELSQISQNRGDKHPTGPAVVSVTMGEIYLSQGKFQDALTIFEELLKKDPENERLQRKIADIQSILNA